MKLTANLSRRNFVKTAVATAVAAEVYSSTASAAQEISRAEAMIPTARGDCVPASKLGLVLPTDLIIQESPEVAQDWPDLTWGARPEGERIAHVVGILNAAHEGGIGTILDRTIPGIGRNIPRIKKIALQTRLNILVTTGYYVLRDLPYYFEYREEAPGMYPKGDLRLDDLFVRDIQRGIGDTGVRATAIKVVSDVHGITPDVLGTIQAACRAHRKTGAPITTHTVGALSALQQERIFSDQGLDLGRVVYGHQDRTPPKVPLGEFQRLLDKGAYLSFDGWGPAGTSVVSADHPSREYNLKRIADLVRKGYSRQILISSGDLAFADVLGSKFFSGFSFGAKPYLSLIMDIIPALKELGVSDSHITEMTRSNPQRWLGTLAKGGY